MFAHRARTRIPAIFYIYVVALVGMTAFAATHIDATPGKTAPIKIVSR